MKLLLTGASGLIGTAVTRAAAADHEVRRLVRRRAGWEGEYRWDPVSGDVPAEAIEWADAVISLSGASLARLPWTTNYRDEILASRVRATEAVARAIAASERPPRAWVSASAVGVYGTRPGEVLTEQSERGTGFLSDVVTQWEQATAAAHGSTRVVMARTGLVLAADGALKPVMMATRFGLGATVGRGTQHWPWISLEDEARALIHLATNSTLQGPVNLVGPEPATAKQITREIAYQMRRPHLFGIPRFVLKTTMGVAADELLLADQHVVPSALTADGYVFRHGSAEDAIAAALTRH